MAFYKYSPNWFFLMHWLVGTAFMFNFSLFVSVCRTVARPGVMWFIRDPNDQGFNPIREILERPFMWQLRKLGSGALTYFTLIVLGITLPTHFVKFALKGVLPLRWPVE
jgi:E3 ubiquitin-protein ligase DOA10